MRASNCNFLILFHMKSPLSELQAFFKVNDSNKFYIRCIFRLFDNFFLLNTQTCYSNY
uniref:Uncharacterized protein n=1 Tax=Octopus bimaculoides TaxID=37653 RepID=A0A0L8H5D9_OCTBM